MLAEVPNDFRSQLVEENMRLKLSGPDCKDQDAVKALQDFAARVNMLLKCTSPSEASRMLEGTHLVR